MTSVHIVDLLIYALAIVRVTGLVTTDTLTESLRDGIIGWLDDRPRTLGKYLATLITCPWCAGMWVSLAGTGVWWLWGDVVPVFLLALSLAFSQFTGMISGVGRGPAEEQE